MEVIPLDDRVRSTTVLNTAAPSDFTTVYHDNYEIDADALAEDDLAEDAAANEGMWTRRNKLLLSLIAGSALLCAIATGSGVAAHRARVANLNSCPAGMVPNVGASSSASVLGKSSKETSKSSKSPTAKSSKATSGPVPTRMLTGATVNEEVSVGGAYYPSVPKTVEDKRKNRMLIEHLGQRDASSTLSWRLRNLGEMLMNFGGDEEKEQQQRLNYERRLQDGKSSKSPSTKSSKSPTAKSSKSSESVGIVEGLKPSTDNCKCVNSGLNGSSGNGNGGSGAKSSKSPSTKSSKSPSTKSSKSPSTKSSKSPSTKSSKSPSTKSSKASTPGDSGLTSPLAPTACNAPVAPLRPTNPMAPGGKSSKSPTSKTGKSTPQPDNVIPPAVVEPTPPATKRPTASVIPPTPATTPETKSPTPCTVDCPGVPVVDPTPPTPSGGGGDKTPSPTRGGEGENPSVPEPTPPTPGTEGLTPPVPTPSTPGTPDGGPTPSTPTPNCDNDAVWSSEDGKTCDDVADGDANVLCVTASSVGGTSASVACPAVCNTECLTNCDNDEAWESTDGESCVVVAEDPIGLCKSAVNGSGESATTACPASCNKECFVNCDNDPLWIGVQEGETCDDVAENTEGLCGRLNSELVAASEACPAACNPECFPPTVDIPVTFPTGFPKLDSYVPTPEITVGVTVTVGEEDKTPPTPTPSRVVVTPMPTNIGTSIGSSVGSSGGTITVSTETTGPPTSAIREDEQGDDEEVR